MFLLLLMGCFGSRQNEMVEEDIVYHKKDLGDQNAALTQRKAALLDYLGAVYSKDGSFDGKLTLDERNKALDRFIPSEKRENFFSKGDPFSDSTFLSTIFKNARQVFLTSLGSKIDKDHGDCVSVKPRSFSLASDSAFLLGGIHGCYDEYGEAFLNQELNIASHPENWVFFLEGEEYIYPEFKLFDRISNQLGIPKKNPVLATYEKEVINLSSQRYSKPEMLYRAALAYQLFGSIVQQIGNTSQGDRMSVIQLLDLVMNRTSELMKLSEDEKKQLEFAFLIFCKGDKNFKTKQEALMALQIPGRADHLTEISNQLLGELKDVSNELSIPLVKDEASSSSKEGRHQSLFVIGIDHNPIVEQVYSGR